jgi:ABC-type antimicrobial peptide transport system permease subunit
LFGIQPTDITSYILAVLLVIAAGMPASLVPARRAARVDAMTTIREC